MSDEAEKQFKFCDDLMFSSVLSDDPVLVKQMLETILGHPIGNIVTMNVQEVLNYSPDAKSVQLDVYCKDDRSTLFDLEMENRKNRESLKSLPKRTRYYSSVSDAQEYLRGTRYREIKEQYVIFICMSDPFPPHSMAKYEVKLECRDSPEAAVQDEATRIYLFCGAENRNVSVELDHLLNYIGGREAPRTELTKRIEEKTEIRNKDHNWRRKAMTLDEKMRELAFDERLEGREEGREEGRDEKCKEIVFGMLEDGRSEEEIISILKMIPSETISALVAKYIRCSE